MVKPLSILLSVLLFLQGMRLDVSDIAQFDELLEHARFHSQKYGDNFLVFLSKHYGDLQEHHNQAHQEEQGEHEELPFNHHSCQHLATTFLLLTRPLPLTRALVSADTSANFHYQETYSSFQKFDIFQPPRNI